MHQLAIHSRLVDPDALEAVVEAAVQGDFAATTLEDALRTLPPTVVLALEHASDLAAIEFAECTRLLGADEATELLRALDTGAVMHVIERGRRVVPPILRRHLRARAGLLPSELRLPGPSVVAGTADLASTAPRGSHAPDEFEAALSRLRSGDVVAAVPLLRRVLRREGAPNQEAARLALLVIRESIAPRETTLDALAALERECVARGLDRLGRVVRGAIAAASGLPERVTQGVVDECELRGDDRAAALVAGIALLVRLRHGRATSAQATAVADRLDHLAIPDAAVWARASGALLAAASGCAATHDLITDAETASIATGQDGARRSSTPLERSPDRRSGARIGSRRRDGSRSRRGSRDSRPP